MNLSAPNDEKKRYKRSVLKRISRPGEGCDPPLFPPIEIAAIAAIFNWNTILVASFIGLLGVLLADRTGFMPTLDPRISNRQRYHIPLLIGCSIGALASLIDLVTNGTQFLAENMGISSFNMFNSALCRSG